MDSRRRARSNSRRSRVWEDWMAAFALKLANRILDFEFKTAILDLV
jgi:hypothetical protein